MRPLLTCYLIALGLLPSGPARAIETIQWDQTVIPLELIVGVEQLVQFQGSAVIGVPASLANPDTFRHLFVNDTAYWKALEPFGKQRVKVRLESSGGFVLFDISAKTVKRPPKSVEPISIVVTVKGAGPISASTSAQTEQAITMFDLIRYAAQSDHSPPRVVAPLAGVRPVEQNVHSELSRLYNHADSVNLDMFARATWSVGGWYVTAIEVRNRTKQSIEIDPSRLQHTAHGVVNGVANQFMASALIRGDVAPRGKTDDTTFLYVVTDKPFSAVIDL
jgi:integrating conjugative element protein (TIGR03749 family)